MRELAVAALFFALISAPASANDRGLHNSSKNFTNPKRMSFLDWTDPKEMQRSWQAAIVRIPNGKGRSKRSTVAKLLAGAVGSNEKLPTIVYLHGCAGIWSGTHFRMKFLANHGYLVIAPASFARKKYPKSCDTDTYESGLYRHTLKMRQADAGYAIAAAKRLPMVDEKRIVLMGLSQGGITTATFSAKQESQKVSARIIEGWTCHAGWHEYKGLNAPETEPVLALVGAKDPWFQDDDVRGDCTRLINKTNGSKSVVYKRGGLAKEHALLEYPPPRRAVLEFLKQHLN